MHTLDLKLILVFESEVKKRSPLGPIMAKKTSDSGLPTWAVPIWEQMGSPSLADIASVHNGDLLERRHGLRKDDLVEILLDARAFKADEDTIIKGRLLSSGKTGIEVLTDSGEVVYIARDVIVKITLIAHTRPAYIDDKELLAFERADMKRRSSLHEKVEKEVKGRQDDSHLWG